MSNKTSYRVAPTGHLQLLRRELNDILADLGGRLTLLEATTAAAAAPPATPPVPILSARLVERATGGTQAPITSTLDYVFDGQTRVLPSLAYELSFPFIGTFSGSQEVALHEFVRTVTFPANFGASPIASLAYLGTAPTGNPVFVLNRITADTPTQIGTISFTSGNQAGTLATTGGTVQVFAPGDILQLVAPATPDGTAADLTVNLTGTRSNP